MKTSDCHLPSWQMHTTQFYHCSNSNIQHIFLISIFKLSPLHTFTNIWQKHCMNFLLLHTSNVWHCDLLIPARYTVLFSNTYNLFFSMRDTFSALHHSSNSTVLHTYSCKQSCNWSHRLTLKDKNAQKKITAKFKCHKETSHLMLTAQKVHKF